MRCKALMHSAMAIALALATAACARQGPPRYTGPGCLIYVYDYPGLLGYALPVRVDTPDLSAVWSKSAASARVVYGTWRLYTRPHYRGFIGDFKAPAYIMRLQPIHKLGSLECIMQEPPPYAGW